jgi:hypothetical protein
MATRTCTARRNEFVSAIVSEPSTLSHISLLLHESVWHIITLPDCLGKNPSHVYALPLSSAT